MISFDEFKKVEIAVGKILTAERVPETDKLLRLMVDFGNNTNYESDTNIQMGTTTTQVPSSPTTPSRGLGPSYGSCTPFASEDGRSRSCEASSVRFSPPRAGVEEDERDVRQIISGIAGYFPEPSVLVGKKCMFVTNLEPRIIKGLESNGMLFAVSTDDGKFSLLEPSTEIPEGTLAR